ncbi:TetR/AcrR family transcriptional regulator [uncultured Roseobacter sp.]|uniref:TetR/AcrR family transcriptional regulator n=1 Tax=uncultured Roseobacter sp. TaxID=114847 RepID=UPI0026280D9E|nr:TetR/AcrR family transcriptional regulator [uncultured Roseobacter sp.]
MSKRSRGRPRQFEEEDVLDSAANLFLRHGYDDVTVAALAEHLALSKPSLYGAFGDKHALYLRTVEAYGAKVIALMESAMAASASLPEAARSYLERAVDHYAPEGQPPLGCLIVTTMTTAAGHDADIRAWLERFVDDSDNQLADILTSHFGKEVAATGLTALQLARMLQATLHSLATRARAGVSRTSLFEMIDTTIFVLESRILPNLHEGRSRNG